MKKNVLLTICALTVAVASSGFAATCDIFQRTEGSNYRLRQQGKQVEIGQKIVQVANRLYLFQSDDNGNLSIMGLLFPLGRLEAGKFGDPAYVVAVGSPGAVTLIDYSADTQISCRK